MNIPSLHLIAVFTISLVLLSGSMSASYAISIVQNNNADDLVDAISGMGITIVGTPTLSGLPVQSGTFSDGLSEVGMESGIVLHTGDVAQIPGANNPFAETRGNQVITAADDVSMALGGAGDSDLDTLTGATTFDASVLEFDFQFGDGTVGGDLIFMFAFASEEYINYIDSSFNDGFLLEVDGVNVGTTTGLAGGGPITVNNINDLVNPGLYVNNVANTDGIPNASLDIHFDGLTTVVTASLPGLSDGTHSVKFAVADAADGILDAGVFIQGDSFQNMQPGLWIVKQTTGGDDTFSFTSPQLGDFDIETIDGEGIAHFPDQASGVYEVFEVNDENLISATCDNDDDPSEVTLEDEQMVTCTFVNDNQTESPVAGELLALDNTSLLIAGLSANMGLFVPIAAGLAGVGAYFVRRSMNKE